jgi:hypothetical protein
MNLDPLLIVELYLSGELVNRLTVTRAEIDELRESGNRE